MALTANGNLGVMPDQKLRQYPVAAAVHIYRDGIMGLDPAGMLKPFVPGDELVGLAYEEIDNSAGAAAAKKCRVRGECDFPFALSGAANLDAGRAVYATADDAIALIGHPDAFLGRVLHKDADAANSVIVRMKNVNRWTPADTGALEFLFIGGPVNPTGQAGAAADFVQPSGMIASSVVGLGVTQALVAGGGADLTFDATSEVADASLRTPAVLLASKGVTFHGILHATVLAADTSAEFDWGLETLTDTAASRATPTGINALTDIALFNMVGNAADINAQSDNGTTDVAPTDTTVDNVVTAVTGEKEFHVIVRPSGAVEFWIDRVRVLATTTFAVATTALLGGIVNMVKTVGTVVPAMRIRKLRVCGAAGVQF